MYENKEWVIKMNDLKQEITTLRKHITSNILLAFTILIIFLGILIWRAFYLHNYISVAGTKNGHLFDYWNMIWTAVGTMAIPLTIITFLIDKNNHRKKMIENEQKNEVQKQKELRELMNKEEKELQAKKRALIENEIPSFWCKYNTHYQSNKSSENNVSRENLSPETNDMLTSGIRILFKINAIQEYFTSKDSSSDDIEKYSELIVNFLANYKTLITDDFPVLNTLFDKFDSQSTSLEPQTIKTNVNLANEIIKLLPNSDDIKTSNTLIIRTLDSSGSIERITGDWKMSAEKAKNIKYIIGVTGSAYGKKSYLKTAKVMGSKSVGDRVRFISDSKIILDNTVSSPSHKTEEMRDKVNELVENWNAINPIVYMSHMEAKLKEMN